MTLLRYCVKPFQILWWWNSMSSCTGPFQVLWWTPSGGPHVCLPFLLVCPVCSGGSGSGPFGGQGFPHAPHKACQAVQGIFRYCDGGKKFNQLVARVNGGSNYDSLKVLCQFFSGTVMVEQHVKLHRAFSGTVMDSIRGPPCLFTFSPGVSCVFRWIWIWSFWWSGLSSCTPQGMSSCTGHFQVLWWGKEVQPIGGAGKRRE